ncbi:MAG: Rho termination factor [Flavobacteriales bacterium]|nr:Rho termination factor [Flavobacteriales bacterium]
MSMKSSINNEAQYEALLDEGMSKEKAARIANTENPDTDSRPYEERTRTELYKTARKAGIEGRSKMDKEQLIAALREE